MKTKKVNLEKWFFHYGDIKKREDDRLNDIMLYHETTKAGGRIGNEEYWKNNNEWTTVTVPHDWCCELKADPKYDPANGYKERNVGWYYTEINVPSGDFVTLLSFDGVSNHCEVYVNGLLVVRNFSGYTGFECDISDYILEGEKATIAVCASIQQWEGWWYEGGGIYRPVSVYFKNKLHIKNMETFVKPILKDDNLWNLQIQSKVCNNTQEMVEAQLIYELKDSKGNVITNVSRADKFIKEENLITVDFDVDNPLLWSPDTPCLYNMSISLVSNTEILDEETISFGFRDIKWISEQGMYLNGNHYMIKGICCHQDHGGVGTAVSEDVTRYRIKKLKKMGANAYRCAHHNPSKELLKVCDEEGMLVLAENRHFSTADEVVSQMEYLTKNCRNHPSVFVYTLFNEETYWQHEIRGKKMAEKLKTIIDKLDGTRAVTAAINYKICDTGNASEVLDIAGLNYQVDEYQNYHKIYKHKIIIGTENAPIYATRGVYKQDDEKQVFNCYGDVHPGFAESLDDTMGAVENAPWVAGVFLWSGFDYRGEPTPYRWPTVISHWGLTDICGFEKDTYYIVKAYYSKEPFVHILPHWNHSKDDVVRVVVFTNCSDVTLFLNDVRIETKEVRHHRAEFSVRFEEGVLTAKGSCGEVIVTDCVKTTDKPEKLCFEVVDGETDKIINVWIEDKNGNIIPDADNMVDISVRGAILIGSANGNPNVNLNDKSSSVPLFSGRCQFIIRTKKDEKAEIVLSSLGFKSSKLII